MNDEQPTTNPLQEASEKLLAELNLTDIPEEQKQALIDRIVVLMDQEILLNIMTRLTDEEINELEQVLEKEGDEQRLSEEAYQFLQDKIPGLDKVVEDSAVSVLERLKSANNILAS